jgi:hypothetical protein
MTEAKKDVEMKDVEESKEEKKEVPKEPQDPFYGNLTPTINQFRNQEKPCPIREGGQRKGL